MDKLLNELEAFIADGIKKCDDSYAAWYKESAWYKKPTLEEAFGDSVAKDITKLKAAIEEKRDLISFVDGFKETAKEYGKSWYDDDLKCERTGYEWETKTYVELHNMVAKSVGKPLIDFDSCYEGYGY